MNSVTTHDDHWLNLTVRVPVSPLDELLAEIEAAAQNRDAAAVLRLCRQLEALENLIGLGKNRARNFPRRRLNECAGLCSS